MKFSCGLLVSLLCVWIFFTQTIFAEQVIIQPVGSSGYDTFITTLFPDQNNGDHPNLKAGWTEGHVYRSMIKFSLDQIPLGSTIQSATLRLWGTAYGTTDCTIQINQITSYWNEGTTWNTRPDYGGAIVTVSKSPGYAGLWDWDATDLVTEWYQGTATNYGFNLRSHNSSENNLVWFLSSNADEEWPRLIVNYNSAGPQADLRATDADVLSGYGTYNPGGVIEMLATAINQGPDDATPDDYNLNWYVSVDTTITTSDFYMCTDPGNKQFPYNTSQIFQIVCTLPASLSEGNYYIGYIINCSIDPNTGNNSRCDSIPINVTTNPTQPPDCINHGDVNLDHSLTAADAQLAFLIVLGSYSPTYQQECAADCNGSGDITAADAQAIFLSVLGLGTCVDPI